MAQRVGLGHDASLQNGHGVRLELVVLVGGPRDCARAIALFGPLERPLPLPRDKERFLDPSGPECCLGSASFLSVPWGLRLVDLGEFLTTLLLASSSLLNPVLSKCLTLLNSASMLDFTIFKVWASRAISTEFFFAFAL